MTEHFLTYEQSLAVKGLGFDEPCFGKYLNSVLDTNYHLCLEMSMNEEFEDNRNRYFLEGACSAPLKSQFFKWVREKYSLRGFIGWRPNVKKFDYHVYDMSLSGIEYAKQRTMEEYNKDPLVGTYEEAEDGCINKIIEILKLK